MSKLITLPDPRLRQKSTRIGKIDKDVKALIARMKQAAIDWETNRPHELSTALAAVQIGELKSLIIIRQDFENPKNQNFVALINPEIIKQTGKLSRDFEGCLSVPDFYGQVPRYPKIKVKAKNESGQTVFIKAEGFLARTLQHEIDHTNGITFVDRIKNDQDAFYKLEADGSLRKADYDTEVRTSSLFRD